MDETTRHRGSGTIVTGGYGADGAVECASPFTSEIGEYAHRLVIPGDIHPAHGEQRFAFNRAWTWDADRHGWERIA